VAQDETKREEMLKKANGSKTVPQIFVGDHHLGGNAELQTLEKEGRLNSLLGI
jgi:glutaredoxin 3